MVKNRTKVSDLHTRLDEVLAEMLNEKVKEHDFDDNINDAVHEYDFEKCIDAAVEDFNFDRAIGDAVDNHEFDFDDKAQAAVEEAVSNADFDKLAEDAITSKIAAFDLPATVEALVHGLVTQMLPELLEKALAERAALVPAPLPVSPLNGWQRFWLRLNVAIGR